MKKVIVLILFCLTASIAFAQESSCPSHKAGEMGHSAFEVFHAVVAPAWHEAYPAKDYAALVKAAPEFAKAFDGIAEMKPVFLHKSREEAFGKHRAELGQLVAQYAEAAQKQQNDLVYEIMPKLHDAFEMTAMATLPIEYPLISGLMVTCHVIKDMHLPKANVEGVAGSTETLATKVALLDESTIPVECAAEKAALLTEIAAIKKLTEDLKAALAKNDMTVYAAQLDALIARLKDIDGKYLQA